MFLTIVYISVSIIFLSMFLYGKQNLVGSLFWSILWPLSVLVVIGGVLAKISYK